MTRGRTSRRAGSRPTFNAPPRASAGANVDRRDHCRAQRTPERAREPRVPGAVAVDVESRGRAGRTLVWVGRVVSSPVRGRVRPVWFYAAMVAALAVVTILGVM